jgi:hypothetical protein
MESDWFVRPKTERLSLSEGQWLLVKQRLTTGEYRAHLKRSSRVDDHGVRHVDLLEHSLSLVIAYLVDWSLEAPIRGESEADVIAALDTLVPERFAEIKAAIEAHETAMAVAREQEKNATAGEKNAAAISPSPSAAAGALSGSVN